MLQDLVLRVQEFVLTAARGFQELTPFKRLVLFVCIIGIIPGYFASRTLAKIYWHNQYSSFIVSAHPSFTNPKPLIPGNVTLVYNSDNTITAIAEIKNDNLDLSAQKLNYKIEFLNSSNQVVQSQTGTTFILPSQKKNIILPKISGTENITTGKLILTQPEWQKRKTLPKVSLTTPLPFTRNILNPLAFIAEGAVTNNSPYRLGQVFINFTAYNSNNEIVASTQRSEFSLKPGERRAYVLTFPNLYTSEVSRVTVSSETNILEGENLVLEGLPENSGGSLSRPETDPF